VSVVGPGGEGVSVVSPGGGGVSVVGHGGVTCQRLIRVVEVGLLWERVELAYMW